MTGDGSMGASGGGRTEATWSTGPARAQVRRPAPGRASGA
ncbi:hypothetical protein APASM_5720 [Actinosynnema pretiosum subsp. pretiosum]|nr:hypothetical protein APASM_5720 [Actinosynnema pretiosum subsp. pretiosum]